jgi:hypothetical protein
MLNLEIYWDLYQKKLLLFFFIFGICSILYGQNSNEIITKNQVGVKQHLEKKTYNKYQKIVDPPVFSHEGGFYNNQFNLSFNYDSANTRVYYTNNGQIPDTNSNLYSGLIKIYNTQVIRAKSFDFYGNQSETATNTFFINENNPLPVFSISTDPENLWGTNGIYVGNYDYEIPISIEMFEKNGDLAFKHNAGAEIFGSGSSGFDQKSLAIFFRSQYGIGELEFNLFPELPYVEYESFLLRNGGNDWWSTLIRDAMTSNGLMKGTNLDFQEYRPSIVYLNGEYWSIHNIREKVNEHFIEDHHYISRYNLDMIEYKEEVIPLINHGDLDHYNSMLYYLEIHDLTYHNFYEYVKTLIDINNFIDYQIVEIYCANIDWPANNNRFWRPRNKGGKWRWILYDTDTGFGLWDDWWTYGIAGYELDHIAHATNTNDYIDAWPNPPWSTFIFRKLLENNSFRNDFINRFADYLNTRLSSQSVQIEISRFYDGIRSALPDHLERWGRYWQDYNFELNKIKKFAANRPKYVRQHLIDHFNLGDTVSISLHIEPEKSGTVKLNTLLITENNWSGVYFSSLPIKLSAASKPGYKFKKWLGTIETSSGISIYPWDNLNLTALFEPDSGGSIVINEINYNSGNIKNPGDWFELYNNSYKTINFAGWTFTDQRDTNVFYFPQNLIIESDQYLVVCRDMDQFQLEFPFVENVTGSFEFGLSSGGDEILLFDQNNQLVDAVTFENTTPWDSIPNGNGPTLELVNPSLDNSLSENWAASIEFGTPGKQNSRYDIRHNITGTSSSSSSNKILNFPNPFLNYTVFRYKVRFPGQVKLKVYNILGQEVITLINSFKDSNVYEYTWNGINKNGVQVSSGIYFYVLEINYEIVEIKKMIKLR